MDGRMFRLYSIRLFRVGNLSFQLRALFYCSLQLLLLVRCVSYIADGVVYFRR